MQGIYVIINDVNGKAYVGQSMNIWNRWSYHKHCAFNPTMYSYDYPLYRAIRKYGIDNFTFEVLETVEASALLTEKEQHYYDAIGKEDLYNILAPTENASVRLGNAVYQIEPVTLQIVAEYASVSEASRVINVNSNSIETLIKGNGQMVSGYHWCLVNQWSPDWRPKELVYNSKPKIVVVLDPETEETLLEFDSIRDAARIVVPDTNLDTARRSIARACVNMRTTAYGYKWAFKEE